MSAPENSSSRPGRVGEISESTFPERVARVVELAGGASELARRTGISRRMIGKYGQGAEPSRESLVQMARAAGVSLVWLATGEGPEVVESAGGREEPGADWDELDEILRLVSRPGNLRTYGRGRLTVNAVMTAIMQHGIENGWSASQLERASRISAIIYQVLALANEEQDAAARPTENRAE